MSTNLEQYQQGTTTISQAFIYAIESELDQNIESVYDQFIYEFSLPPLPLSTDSYNIARIIMKYYMSRGFHVIISDNKMIIKWNAPDISWQDLDPTSALTINQIPQNFTAQQLYLIATNGNDLRQYEPYYLYKELSSKIIQQQQLQASNTYTYYKFVLGIPQTTLTNLYVSMINLFAQDGIVAEFLSNGVLQLTWTGTIVPPIDTNNLIIDGGTF